MTNPLDFYWYRVRKGGPRWHVIISDRGSRNFPTLETAAIYAATLEIGGYIDADKCKELIECIL